jgi:hypothetical protein
VARSFLPLIVITTPSDLKIRPFWFGSFLFIKLHSCLAYDHALLKLANRLGCELSTAAKWMNPVSGMTFEMYTIQFVRKADFQSHHNLISQTYMT